jgi:hypothetical protein
VITLDQLLALPGSGLEVAAAAIGADPDKRTEVEGYEGLSDLDVVESTDGANLYLRGDDVVLVFVDETALPDGLDDDALQEAVGSGGEELRSRQGKRANLHVVAERGIAWSEEDGAVGFVELFPPTTLKAYRREIYRKPPKFIR